MTYEEQVMDAADADGLLSIQLVNVLMSDHETSVSALVQDGYTGHHQDAAALLEWMGY